MHRVGTAPVQDADQQILVEIRVTVGVAGQQIRLIRHLDVLFVTILFGVHSDRANAHFPGGAHDAQRDFAAVRHQKFADSIDHAFQAMTRSLSGTGAWTTKNPRSFCNPPQTSP